MSEECGGCKFTLAREPECRRPVWGTLRGYSHKHANIALMIPAALLRYGFRRLAMADEDHDERGRRDEPSPGPQSLRRARGQAEIHTD